jgi:O-Antigen ligase
MIVSPSYRQLPLNASTQRRRTQIMQALWMLGILGLSALIGLLMYRRAPTPSIIAWVLFYAAAAATVYQPRYGVYMIAGLSLAGDSLLTPWYPFVKNLSSWESLLYLHDAISFSPMELFLGLTTGSLMLRWLSQRQIRIETGRLFWPAILFGVAIAAGLGYGLANGGNFVIALWESRAIFVLPLMLILVTNLITTREHVNVLIWWVIIGVFADAVSGLVYVAVVLNFDWSTLQAIAEHSYSIHINSLFILLMASWFYKASVAKRITLSLMLPVLLISYAANQRRAAYVTIAVAMLLWGILLYWQNRRLFWVIVPPVLLFSALYLAIFWGGGGGPIGAPARMLRNAIAPEEGGEEASSNLYRLIENINTMFTIRTAPVFGVGFGNKFHVIAQMPDISFFIWWEYITHNSILWIWMKAGLAGFMSMIFLLGMTMQVGARAVVRMPGRDLTAIALMALTYIVMHFVYAYVDISWESQSMVLVGTMMGLLNSLERIAAVPIPPQTPRWPWQVVPASPEGLRPL